MELNTQKVTMKELPDSEKPYEKLMKYGPAFLSDAELLAIIFRVGSRGERAVETAQRLLCLNDHNPGLIGLYDMSLKDLQRIKGIGQVKSIQIQAVMELSKRIAKCQAQKQFKISSPSAVAHIYMEEMRYLKQEHFKVVLLDTKNKIIGDRDVTIGSINSSIVHPREVFKEAIQRSAAHIIIVHNHPSGDPTPSREDIEVTKRIIEAGNLLGVPVLDHIIIGNGKYISLKEKDLC
ncbi:MAG: DNA repair protein RadC [Epulopiscium sp.]|nr:DNA repair protein RadC [Candidatus Epulonipiscium sp.]